MAWQILRSVMENNDVGGAAKLVALVLANYANEKGLAWPSIESLAEKTGLSTRQIQRLVPQIEKAGLLRITTGGGPLLVMMVMTG